MTSASLPTAAKRYLDAGLSVLPAKRAEKRPAVRSWKKYQGRLPTKREVDAWFANRPDGLCLLTGAVSGNLELLDFDFGGELFQPWAKSVQSTAPGLIDRLVIETSQSGGRHVVYRCESEIGGNTRLAQRANNDGRPVTLIETRGDRGLFLCAPTAGYELLQGDLAEPPVLTQSERQTLLQTARELNQYAPEKPSQTHDVGPCGPPLLVGNQDRPGDDFNARGDVAALLKKRGWQSCGIRPDGNEHWTRPGKPRGSTSATLKDGQFYVFSSNAAPFEQDKAYCPFAVYAMLEHKGDFAKATQTLSTEGFGGREPLGCDVDLSNLIGTVAEDSAQSEDDSAAKKKKKKLLLVRADQIEMRPPEWLLRGVLERDTLALVFGEPGCGKSFLAIDWATRIATGTAWRDHPVQAGPVIYVAGEGHNGLGRRLHAWQEYHEVSIQGAPLFVAPAVAIPHAPSLLELIAAIDEGKQPSLIVLDTLARNFGGGDENSTQDMSQFVAACDTLRRRYRCTLLVVHHTGHGEKGRARGAMALKAALDAEYRLDRTDSGLTLTATKMKDAETPDPLSMELVSVALPGLVDEYGNPISSAAVDVVDADTGAIVSAAKAQRRGKWQEVGLAVAKRLMAQHGGGVSIDAWREECQAAGMVRQNQHRVLEALGQHGDITLKGGVLHVVTS